MKVLFLFLTFLSFSAITFSQKKDTSEIIRPYFFASANFEMNVTGKVMPSSGLQLGLGINLARLFTKKFVLGFYGETSVDAKFSSNNKFSELNNEVNNNLIYQQDDFYDSMKVEFLSSIFNQNQFKGCIRSNFGLAFSPFPDKYGKIILFLSAGKSVYPFWVKNESQNAPSGNPYHEIVVPTFFKASLVFKPLSLTKMKDKNFLKDHLQLGFYIQYTAFQHARIDNRSISTYLKPEFFTGNRKSEIQFGMRIGIGIGFFKQIRL